MLTHFLTCLHKHQMDQAFGKYQTLINWTTSKGVRLCQTACTQTYGFLVGFSIQALNNSWTFSIQDWTMAVQNKSTTLFRKTLNNNNIAKKVRRNRWRNGRINKRLNAWKNSVRVIGWMGNNWINKRMYDLLINGCSSVLDTKAIVLVFAKKN